MRKTKEEQIRALVEDVRGILTPFWMLTTLIKSEMDLSTEDKFVELLHKQADTAEGCKKTIEDKLDKILELI